MRSALFSRLATGIALTAAALGLTVVPSAAADTAPAGETASAAAPLTVITVPSRRLPPGAPYIPPRAGNGDADFAGHGPDFVAQGFLDGAFAGSRVLSVRLCVDARETRSDFTRAVGCTPQQFLVYQAPPGECIQSVNVGTFEELQYRDHDHGFELFDGQIANSFVASWRTVGDTPGDEAGTETGAHLFTRDFTVTSVPC
jgi:hypothetical protein